MSCFEIHVSQVMGGQLMCLEILVSQVKGGQLMCFDIFVSQVTGGQLIICVKLTEGGLPLNCGDEFLRQVFVCFCCIYYSWNVFRNSFRCMQLNLFEKGEGALATVCCIC